MKYIVDSKYVFSTFKDAKNMANFLSRKIHKSIEIERQPIPYKVKQKFLSI